MIEEPADMEDLIIDEIARTGKQPNVSMFAFTATPKPTTLQLFGRLNRKGQREAFHIYSMKQAIEEGFILDVLSNYTEYGTYYDVIKASEDDPILKTLDAKRQIHRVAMLSPENIEQRAGKVLKEIQNGIFYDNSDFLNLDK